ncbi:phage tail tube protein [Tateyamaria sp. syn59]|uniref:phage tail tube protein n=1 Tax=Tateyamaria sp. syn59 TaxID=2576942 RepID=UPI0011BE5128|nr:phage tail tube protein [Tateyamaria sp. syn59]
MTDAIIGNDSEFLRGTTSVGEVIEIGPPSLSRDTVDATHMKSPGRWREFIAALKDGGEVTVVIQSPPASSAFQAMIADFNNDDAEEYTIRFPDGSTWAINAFITGLETDPPMDDRVTSTATFKITGEPVFAVV